MRHWTSDLFPTIRVPLKKEKSRTEGEEQKPEEQDRLEADHSRINFLRIKGVNWPIIQLFSCKSVYTNKYNFEGLSEYLNRKFQINNNSNVFKKIQRLSLNSKTGDKPFSLQQTEIVSTTP